MEKNQCLIAVFDKTHSIFYYDGTGYRYEYRQTNTKRSNYNTIDNKYNNWKAVDLDGLFEPSFELFTAEKGFGDGEVVTGMRQGGIHVDIKSRVVNNDMGIISTGNSDRIAEATAFHDSILGTPVDLTIRYAGLLKYSYNAYLTKYKIEAPKNQWKSPILTATYLIPEGTWLTE